MKFSAASSVDGLPSVNKLYMLDSFQGTELSASDFEGAYFVFDAGASLGLGASATAIIAGIPLHKLQDEIARFASVAAIGASSPLGGDLLINEGRAEMVGLLAHLFTGPAGPHLAKHKHAMAKRLESDAKAFLATAGFKFGVQGGASVSAGIGVITRGAQPDMPVPAPILEPPIGPEHIEVKHRITTNDRATVIQLSGDMLFDFDKHTIKPRADRALILAANAIRSRSARRLRVNGHTDGIGSHRYNMELSKKRADAVASWLVRHHAMSEANIQAVGLANSDPVAKEKKANGADDSEGRAKNRRVEIVVFLD